MYVKNSLALFCSAARCRCSVATQQVVEGSLPHGAVIAGLGPGLVILAGGPPHIDRRRDCARRRACRPCRVHGPVAVVGVAGGPVSAAPFHPGWAESCCHALRFGAAAGCLPSSSFVAARCAPPGHTRSFSFGALVA